MAMHLLVFICFMGKMVFCSADDATTPGTSGAAVAKDVVQRIKDSKIFPDDNNFLIRIAQVESRCGEHKDTYRAGYHGGIWQVDKTGFEDTKKTASHPGLKAKLDAINEKFGIDWTKVKWEDLRKPLYSALAARLRLSNIPEAIPKDIAGQAAYWKKYYNTEAGAGTVKHFIDAASTVKGDPHVTQIISGSDKPICYDVFGNGGDVLRFLVEPFLSVSISAQLTGDTVSKFVAELVFSVGTAGVYVTADGADIDGRKFDWATYVDIDVGDEGDINIKVDSSGMCLSSAGLVWACVTRHVRNTFEYLDFAIHHVGSLRNDTRGILGDVSHSAEIVEHGDTADLHLLNADGTTSILPLKHSSQCWKLKWNMEQEFKEILLRNKMHCLSC